MIYKISRHQNFRLNPNNVFLKKIFFNFWEFNNKLGVISSFDKKYIYNSKALVPNLIVIKSRIINNATIFVVSYNFECLI